jgi:hypothetical protein
MNHETNQIEYRTVPPHAYARVPAEQGAGIGTREQGKNISTHQPAKRRPT